MLNLMALMMLSSCFVGLVTAGSGAAPTDELNLFKLPPATVGGRCADGSPSAWYYGAPANDSVTEWVIWLEGGGACLDANKCNHRNTSSYRGDMSSDGLPLIKLTGSKDLPDKKGKAPSPSKWILSDDPQGNPDFYHAHKVHIHYCSSDEHAGTQTTASKETFGYYFGGKLSLQNIFGVLKAGETALGSASRVLFAGSSAGGIGVFHNVDWVQDFFPSTTVVKAAPLGGWFTPGFTADQPETYYPPSVWPQWEIGQVTDWSAYNSTNVWRPYYNPACAKSLGPEKEINCVSATVVYPFIKTPMFIMENNYDTNQLQSGLGFPNPAPTDQKAQDYVKYFGQAMRNSTAQVNAKPDDALFLSSCFEHTEGLGVGPDYLTTINGKDPGALLGQWFYDRLPASDRILIDDCGELPCNPTCIDYPGPPGPDPSGKCDAKLKELCPEAKYPTDSKCAKCCEESLHEVAILAAGCKKDDVAKYCEAA